MIKLNKSQKEAVETTKGAVLVIAGAGSGKTRCIIERSANLIENFNVSPQNLFIATFTNKAANEIKERFAMRFGERRYYRWIGTFHSLCSNILRDEALHIPFTSNFSIIDETDKKAVIKRVMKQLNIDSERFAIKSVIRVISRNKNNLISENNFFDYNQKSPAAEMILRVYQNYQKILKANNSMDFDDLIFKTITLLKTQKTVCEKYQKMFHYLMVDEFQDTNTAQYSLVKTLAGRSGNICVVGDDDQSIYSFRGANIGNILSFEKDFKDTRVIKLEKNYRSGQGILNLANSLISHSIRRYKKELYPSQTTQDIIPILTDYDTDMLEAKEVVRSIRSGLNLGETAILYRINSLSRLFETALVEAGVSFEVKGGFGFYERKQIKDALAFFRIICNPKDDNALIRIINTPPRGIGKKSVEKLLDACRQSSKSIMENFENGTLDKLGLPKVSVFLSQISSWIKEHKTKDLVDMAKHVFDDLKIIGYYLESEKIEDYVKAENLKELIIDCQDFADRFYQENQEEATLSDFLNSISLILDKQKDKSAQKVKLMTIHSAKGLEFENVFVVGLEDGLLPHESNLYEEDYLEEERRLLYVAVTRAKKRLFLSYAKSRRSFSKNGIEFNPTITSRFLDQIETNLYHKKEKIKRGVFSRGFDFRSPKRSTRKRGTTLESGKFYQIGQVVKHKTFGRGKILNVDGATKDAKLSISFETGELKRIVGSYVNVEF